ncbi:DUF4258 domain-containing protein [Pelomonas sp. V22]|uniref:DUF4258 domain-containing protein n=1 Tax=Pelomonas sp. V22 TaxID=2822139 RepID=UPI0024A8D8A8|nr:DUF4258 domain-containing protein [Pelomonas sp. V22]MDI4635860.1 DUF4258 domain-containing protein [Pelomonas sp. V22]
MTTLKGIRQLAWSHEFDRADEALGTHSGRIERVRRTAALRRRGCQPATALPAPTRAPAVATTEEVAPNVPDLSNHGLKRLQQRGITMDQVVTILDYGREQRAYGASRYFLDKKSRELLAVHMPTALRTLPSLDIQVVVSDHGTLITAAHRTRRMRRH